MRPFRGGAVTHNGVVLYRETVLKPGDLIGLGSHFLFLYRDPRVSPAPPVALALPWQGDTATSFGAGNMADRQEALRQYLGSSDAVLKFQAKHADALLQVYLTIISGVPKLLQIIIIMDSATLMRAIRICGGRTTNYEIMKQAPYMEVPLI